MSRALKVANVWQVIKDVDVEAMRRAARERFVLRVVADVEDDATQTAVLLSHEAPVVPHPWIEARAAGAGTVMTTTGAPGAESLAVVLVTRNARMSAALAAARGDAARERVPIVTLLVDASLTPGPLTPEPAEAARIAAPALDSAGARAVIAALLDVVAPDHRLSVARQLPLARPGVFQALIDETARANASFALTTGIAEAVPVLSVPLNLGDIVVLTKNQMVMAYKMALASGRDGAPRELLGEIAGVLGSGLLLRQVARQLVGLIPVVGILPKVAVAYGGTWAIGRAMIAWLTEGRRLTRDAVRSFSSEGLERGRDVARRLLESVKR